MTPEQLEVERDALLAGGRTLEEVERMQWAGRPQAETETWGLLHRACLTWRKATDGYDQRGDIEAAREAMLRMGRKLLSPPRTQHAVASPDTTKPCQPHPP